MRLWVFSLTVVFLCLFASSCAQRQEALTVQALGTVCTINAYSDGTKDLYAQLSACLENVEKTFSTTREDSELNKVNSCAGRNAVSVSPQLFYVLKSAKEYAALSDGLFDPTVGPLVTLWNIGSVQFRVPSEEEIEKAKQLVLWQELELDEKTLTVFLPHEGMRLDLGAIAKGYAADCLTEILKANNVSAAVINLGGNVCVYGTKAQGQAWTVGIKNPLLPHKEPLLVARLFSEQWGSEISVVTSGAYERFSHTEDNMLYHHIINAQTGYPSDPTCLSATIICSSSMDADALSTIAFMYGSERFLKSVFAQKCEAVFVELDGSVTATKKLSTTISSYSDTQPVRISFK